MRSVVGDVDEKRFTSLHRPFDEAHRLGGEVIHAKALALDQFTISFHEGIVVMSPMPGTETVEIIEPASQRMIGILHPIVPLPESARCVARPAEQISHRRLVQVHPLTTSRGSAVDAAADMMPASQKFSAGGRTDRAHEETIKGSSVPGKGIKIRRFQIGLPFMLRSPQPWSSVKKTTTFGFAWRTLPPQSIRADNEAASSSFFPNQRVDIMA